MNNKNKIVILADPVLLPSLTSAISKEHNLEILLADSRPDIIRSFISNPEVTAHTPVILIDQSVPVAGADFFTDASQKGVPVVVIAASVNEGFAYLAQGATDMVVRSPDMAPEALLFFYRTVSVHIQTAAQKQISGRRRSAAEAYTKPKGKIIAIGSSTGGTETVLHILKQMPANAPPILIVQHMPPVFTKMYAERANAACVIDVYEAQEGDLLKNGLALIAPGDFHMTLAKTNDRYSVACRRGQKVCGQCPSVDVLFESVAETAKNDAVGVILTGMGADGAKGLLKMRRQGAYTIGQDQETSIVYGMPRAAFDLGAVTIQLPLEQISQEILAHV